MTGAVRISIEIGSPADAVFAALTQPAALERWFAEHAEVDASQATYRFWGKHTPGNPPASAATQELRQFDPESSLAYAWSVDGTETEVTIRLEPAAGGTRVTVAHANVVNRADGSAALADFWCLALQDLRSFVEEGVVAWRPDFSLSHSRGPLKFEVDARASASEVYRALIEPEQLDRWIATNASVEPEVGGGYDFGWGDGDGGPLRLLELEADRRVAFSWRDNGPAESIVTWELEDSDGATRITMVHSGFAPDQSTDGYYLGWADFVVRLKWMVEKGAGWRAPTYLN